MPTKTEKEKKLQDSFLRPLENKIWPKLAPKVSKVFTPNQLNLISILGAFLNGVCFYLTSYNKYWFIPAIFFAFVFWVADALDGEVARYRKVVNQRGYYIDHMMDSLAIFFLFLGLGLSPALKLPIALIIVIFYFIIAINVLLMTYIENTFRISYGKLGPSECRLILIAFSLISLFFPYPLIVFNTTFLGLGNITLWDAAGIIAAIILVVIVVAIILNNLFYLKKYEKNYKPMTFSEIISAIQFKLQRSSVSKFLAGEDLEKDF